MRVVVVWKDHTDYAREVTDWMAEFEKVTGKKVESVDPETIEGEMFVRARGMMQYPSVVALNDEGSVLKEWKGTPLPQFEEVQYYTREM